MRDIELVKTFNEALERMRSPQFDPCRHAVLTGVLPAVPEEAPSGEDIVKIRIRRAGRTELEVEASSAGLLIVSESFYPGWYAYRNREPLGLYQANGVLQGVWVPEGHSNVVLEYSPTSVRVGCWMTASTFAGVALWGLLLLFSAQIGRNTKGRNG